MKIKNILKKGISALLAMSMTVSLLPPDFTHAAETNVLELENEALHVGVNDKNGGFVIRTTKGDKVNKKDDKKRLIYEAVDDNTSFLSFQVTRGDQTREYIFGGSYAGSSQVKVTKSSGAIDAVWSVDDITFTQSFQLINQGSNEHGMSYISCTAKNEGEPAEIKCRLLLDTALGSQDYAWYNIGDGNNLVTNEKELGTDGYNKSFYSLDNPFSPSVMAYLVNASINQRECKPYKTVFAHWASIAGTKFDYTPDETVGFTNPYNGVHLTADSAVALYYDMGTVAKDGEGICATNYGVYSNEDAGLETKATVNLTAPKYLELNEKKDGYKNDGRFSVKAIVKNVTSKTYSTARVVVYTTGGIKCLDGTGSEMETSYLKPFYVDLENFVPDQTQTLDLEFLEHPRSDGAYGNISIKVYDMSDATARATGSLIAENLLGQEAAYVMIPGLVNELPDVKFTSLSPEMVYNKGRRNIYLMGDNFNMLINKSEYSLRLKRKDGAQFVNTKKGAASLVDYLDIPASNISINTDEDSMTLVLDDDNVGMISPGEYKLVFDYTDESKADDSGPALEFSITDQEEYKNESYGVLAVIKDFETNSGGDKSLGKAFYQVKAFASEEDFSDSEYNNVDTALIVLRGIFAKKEASEVDGGKEGRTYYVGLSTSDGDNPMTINSTLDVKSGTVTVSEEDGTVYVDMDAKISTGSYKIWNGKCTLTALERGQNFSLISYDEEGQPDSNGGNPIGLLWPTFAGEGFQTIMGMLMDFKYGQFGYISHEEEGLETRCVSFGAALNLGFMIPNYVQTEPGDSQIDEISEQMFKEKEPTLDEMRVQLQLEHMKLREDEEYNRQMLEQGFYKNYKDEDEFEDEKKGLPKASVHVDDIIFAHGKCMGVHFDAAVAIPGYVDGMPEMQGILSLNTINKWWLSAEGSFEFETLTVEGAISIKSSDKGVPIPDTVRFFLGDLKPGQPLDPFGVLYVQGGGGGIENLYDTIFLKDKVPPIRILLQVQMSVLQVISARASIEAGLTGFNVGLSEGKVTGIKVLDGASIGVDWYPSFNLLGSVRMGISGILKGTGYVVVNVPYSDASKTFFEFFISAALKIPQDVWIIGGTTIAGAGLGVNREKMWGVVEALSIKAGVTYYWGDDCLTVGQGMEVTPTYPELMAREDLKPEPVYHDEENHRTLYAVVGTNTVDNTVRCSFEEKDGGIKLLGTGDTTGRNSMATTTTPEGGSRHVLELCANGRDRILMLTYPAASYEEAIKLASKEGNVKIADDKGIAYPVKFVTTSVDRTDDVDDSLESIEYTDEDIANANANVTFDDDEKEACLVVTFTEGMDSRKLYNINTAMKTTATLYDMEPLPEIYEDGTEVKYDSTNNMLTANIKGSNLTDFDTMRFVARNEATGEDTLLSYETKADGCKALKNDNGGIVFFELPDNLMSGDYTLMINATDEANTCYSSVEKKFKYTNPSQPADIRSFNAQGAGDYMLRITDSSEDAQTASFDGYEISAYDEEGNVVNGLSGLRYYRNGEPVVTDVSGNVAEPTAEQKKASTEGMLFGGCFSYDSGKDDSVSSDEIKLSAGFDFEGDEGNYKVGVKRFKMMESGHLLTGTEVIRDVKVKRPDPASLTVSADAKAVDIKWREDEAAGTDGEEDTNGSDADAGVNPAIPTYSVRDITLTLGSDQPVSGTYRLDGGAGDKIDEDRKSMYEGSFDSTDSFSLPLTELSDGIHTIEYTAVNENGDCTGTTYMFGVDSTAPTLMMAAPVSGAIFDHTTGKVEVEGITEPGLTVSVNAMSGAAAGSGEAALVADRNGRFSGTVYVDRKGAGYGLVLRVSDEAGNLTTQNISLVSDIMGSIESVDLYVEDADGNMEKTGYDSDALTAGSYRLHLMGNAKNVRVDLTDSSLVEWQEISTGGEAELTVDGRGVLLTVDEEDHGVVSATMHIHDQGGFNAMAVFGEAESEGAGDKESESSSEKTEDSSSEAKDDTSSSDVKDDTSSSDVKEDTSSSEAKDDTSSSEAKDDTSSSDVKDDTSSSDVKEDTSSSDVKDDTSSSDVKEDTSSSEAKDDTSSSEAKDDSSSSAGGSKEEGGTKLQRIPLNITTKNTDGSDLGFELYSTTTVPYNGMKHISNYNKPGKSVAADVTVSINSAVTGFAAPMTKFKNNKAVAAGGKKPYYILSFKAAKAATKDQKKLIKSLNKELKGQPVGFEIEQADLGAATAVSGKVMAEKNKVTKVTATIGGITMKLGKKDYTAEFRDGKAFVKGAGNFKGEAEVK